MFSGVLLPQTTRVMVTHFISYLVIKNYQTSTIALTVVFNLTVYMNKKRCGLLFLT